MAFTTFVLFQMFNLFNARFERASSLGRHALRNAKLWMALVGVVLLQVLVVQVPALQELFTRQDVAATVSPLDWVVMVAAASTVLAVEEARKAVVRAQRSVAG